MSVVACRILEGGGYEMAADSIMVSYGTQSKGDRDNFAKLSEVNSIVIGGVGYAEESSLLYLFASTRKPASATESGILEFFSDFSEWKHKKVGKYLGGNSYLIGFQGKVFSVQGWYVSEVKSFEAIGAGMDYALAALHLGHTAEQAVEVAIELSIYCEAPVVLIRKER